MSKNKKIIKKPWAVISRDRIFAYDIAKVVKYSKDCLWLSYFEKRGTENSDIYPWDPENIKTFDKPIKAIDYFLVNQARFHPKYTQEDILREFLTNFPSERKNLAKYSSKT